MMTDDEARELRAGDYVIVEHDEPRGRPRRVTSLSIGVASVRVRTLSIGAGGFTLPWLPPAALSRPDPKKQWDDAAQCWRDRQPGTRGIFWRPVAELALTAFPDPLQQAPELEAWVDDRRVRPPAPRSLPELDTRKA
jgi:hypothetical protein